MQQEQIDLFADNLAAALKQFPDTDVLLGNGAGSFGHHSAHEYGLKNGAKTTEQFYGVAATHNDVRELNLSVGNALTARGVAAYCLSPGDIFTADTGQIMCANNMVTKELLTRKCVPLVHGDTVVDTSRGVTIFSTEKSLFWLAQGLRDYYERITIAMIVNTGGVLDRDGQIIERLQNDTVIPIVQTSTKDVTGGIEHKVKTCREATVWADEVRIIGNSKVDLFAVFGRESAGTEIL